MGAFFDWLLSNLNWIIPVIFILAFALPILSVIRRLTKGHVSKNSCTVQTVGFIRSTQQTGMYVNENPQLLFELDALAEDGTVFQTSVRKTIPMTAMAGMVPGRAIPIRYNPDNRDQAVWDDHPDELLAQEMGCGTRRVGVVGHLGRRRVDYQHGNHRQRRDDDPQDAVAGKEPELVFFGGFGGFAGALPGIGAAHAAASGRVLRPGLPVRCAGGFSGRFRPGLLRRPFVLRVFPFAELHRAMPFRLPTP